MDPANVNQVKESLLALDSDRCMEAVRSCLADGISPWDIISEGLGKGMREVGDLFEQGEFFLGDLVMAGHVMKEVMAVIRMNRINATKAALIDAGVSSIMSMATRSRGQPGLKPSRLATVL
mgnify:CR=1 FL=1